MQHSCIHAFKIEEYKKPRVEKEEQLDDFQGYPTVEEKHEELVEKESVIGKRKRKIEGEIDFRLQGDVVVQPPRKRLKKDEIQPEIVFESDPYNFPNSQFAMMNKNARGFRGVPFPQHYQYQPNVAPQYNHFQISPPNEYYPRAPNSPFPIDGMKKENGIDLSGNSKGKSKFRFLKDSLLNNQIQRNDEKLFTLVEGVLNPPKKKLIGGKGNNQKLPTHVVHIKPEYLPKEYGLEQILQFKVDCKLFGYKRINENNQTVLKKEKVADLATVDVFDDPEGNPKDLDEVREYVRAVSFNNIVIKFSSHNHGQALCLRFCLKDHMNKEICFEDTANFETITRRGIEKQKQKLKKQMHKQNYQENIIKRNSTPVTINSNEFEVMKIEPMCGKEHQICCIHLNWGKSNFSSYSGVIERSLVIRFGQYEAKEILSVGASTIVCRTPFNSNFVGSVPIQISLDSGLSFMKSGVSFQYLDMSKQEDIMLTIQNL